MQWDLILTKGFSVAIMLGLFALIVVFLRFLYGPKGIFRDPVWDKWNEEARRKLEREEDAKADERLKRAFLAYARGFLSGGAAEDAPVALKIDHTLRVLACAEQIAADEAAFAEHNTGRALRIAALFHDVGRFEQYKKFRTFTDAESCNHGALGARILRREGFLRNETRQMRGLVMGAVAAHNSLKLPARYSGVALDILRGLKDADKLDILRVLSEKLAPGAKKDEVVMLHLKDEDGRFSAPVLDALKAERVALYADMRYYNDFRLLLCSWIFDLHFAASCRMMQSEGHLDALIAGLANIPEAQAIAREKMERRFSIVLLPK